ncbi:MAG: hypothetical protein KDE07_04420 [Sphingomonadaceae bacterium]|nr:hypothetical protein [Sphingomonadaceae bacterium]MCP5384616.1 hypothetical protein [Altererythrobacter sp.]
MLRILLLFVAIGGLVFSQAANASEGVSPSLSARIDGVEGAESTELEVSSLEVDVTVRGGMAVTRLTVAFHNPTGDTLEGEFTLNMPKGSVVNGYALDIEGVMVDGVLQPRDQARRAYMRRVAAGVDPGLAEVDFTDSFSTRIFPIRDESGRTIRVEFSSPLDAQGRYRLPINNTATSKYSFSVNGVRPDSIAGIEWAAGRRGWRASGKGKLDAEITFSVQAPLGVTASEHPSGGKFFELLAPRPVVDREPVREQPLAILWDRSVSRLDDDLEAEAALAERMAQEMGLAYVSVFMFDSEEVERVEVQTDRVRPTLGSVRYAGGTSLARLAVSLEDFEGVCLLFSDGLTTIDDRPDLAELGCRLSVVSSGPEGDRAWLAAQAALDGGAAVDLSQIESGLALERLIAPQNLPPVTDGEGRNLSVRELPAPDGMVRLVGPVTESGQFEFAGTVYAVDTLALPLFAAPGAFWAQQALALQRGAMSSERLAEEARRWSVAVPGVSFVVLEDPSDYVEAGFSPPQSYPAELRAEWAELVEEADEENRAADEAYREALTELWEERKDWWRTSGEEGESRYEATLSPSVPPQEGPAFALSVFGNDEIEYLEATAEEAAADEYNSEAAADAVTVTGSRIANPGNSGSAEPVLIESKGEDPGITIVEWQVERPYVKQWARAGSKWPEAVAETGREHGILPLFYLDLGEWHFQNGRPAEARRAVLAALDLPGRDNQTLEIVAQRLLRYGDPERTIWLLEQLTDREGDRPQPYMALALAHADLSRRTDEREHLVEAERIMSEAALKRWPEEYRKIGEILLAEANALIVELGVYDPATATLPVEFVDPMPVDIRVLAFWNTPRTDLDLWIVEPSDEEVGYNNEESAAGARYTHDLMNGYGPEEYQLRSAPDGTYRIELNTFSADATNPNGPSTVAVWLIRDFGTRNARKELIDVEMVPKNEEDDDEERTFVGTIVIE